MTVLIADDNEVALRLCRRVLEKAGHTVLTASDGLEAVALALANSPVMILLDDAMPGMASLEAMRQIKEQRPGMAIVIATVDPAASNRERFLAAGADDVLNKPFRLTDLLAVVAKLTANGGWQTKPSYSQNASIGESGRDRLLYELAHDLSSSLKLNEVLRKVMDRVINLMHAARGFIVLVDQATNEMSVVMSGGEADPEKSREFLGSKTVLEHVVRSGQAVVSTDASLDDRFKSQAQQSVILQNLRSIIAVPLVTKGKVIGAVYVDNPFRVAIFEEKDKEFLQAIADLAATAIGRLFQDREELFLAVLEEVDRLLDVRDHSTHSHSIRVTQYALTIARQMRYSPTDPSAWARLERSGRLHDIGVIGVPDAILQKAGRLTDEEFTKMKAHTVIGFDMLSGHPMLTDELVVVRSHHERYDGKGYPDRKKGDELPIFVWIVSAADAIDAMTSDRRHQQAMSFEAAIEQVRAGAGTQFHPDVADAVLDAANNGTLKLIPH